MNRIEANRTMIEAFTLLLEGQDQRAAAEIRKLDEAAAKRLYDYANALAILAECAFFEKRRKKRGEKLS